MTFFCISANLVLQSILSGETGERPVRARRREVHKKACSDPEPHPGTRHWRNLRRRNRKYRAGISGQKSFSEYRECRSAEGTQTAGVRKKQNKGDKDDEDETYKKSVVMHPLYGADCGYGTMYYRL